jgi:arginyl-tRNA synthetase
VELIEGNARAAMSKRRGDFVKLDELIDEIGVDATRFFMLQSSHDRTLDLNLDLARSRSADNPVYYVQYAHARIASMLARVGEDRIAEAVSPGASWTAAAGEGVQDLHPSERALVKQLVALPEEIAEAADRRGPHRIAAYSLELAQVFTAFYRDCKVVGATPPEVEAFRIALCVATGSTLALVLGLLGVSAPDSM